MELRRVVEGDDPAAAPQADLRFAPALLGDTRLLNALWHQVFNRCDPSKPGVMRWLEGARDPPLDSSTVTHQRLLRAMDTLADRANAMQRTFASSMPLSNPRRAYARAAGGRNSMGTSISNEVTS